MGQTIVFVHGAWVTPRCWDPMKGFFEAEGYTCLAPTWPHKDHPIGELRASPPPELARLGVTEIVDHYERLIRDLPTPPILIGHSFGGLFVQMLLDRGVGVAGVAIDPAPPRGVNALCWSMFKATAPVLFTWRGWRRIVHMSFPNFRYAFANTMSPADQRHAYEQHVVPETGRIFFQAALAPLDPRRATHVNFRNPKRAPLLIVQGARDTVVAPGVVRATYNQYHRSPARTDFKLFAGRCHWIIAQDGWEEIAGYIQQWLRELPVTSAVVE